MVPGRVVDNRVEADDNALAGPAEPQRPVGVVAVDEVPLVPEADVLDIAPPAEQAAGADDIDVAPALVRTRASGAADGLGPLLMAVEPRVLGLGLVGHERGGWIQVDGGLDRACSVVDVAGPRANEADGVVAGHRGEQVFEGVGLEVGVVIDEPDEVVLEVLIGVGEARVESAAAAVVVAVAHDRERSEAAGVGGVALVDLKVGLMGVVGWVLDDPLGGPLLGERFERAVGRGVVHDDEVDQVRARGLLGDRADRAHDLVLAVPRHDRRSDTGLRHRLPPHRHQPHCLARCISLDTATRSRRRARPSIWAA